MMSNLPPVVSNTLQILALTGALIAWWCFVLWFVAHLSGWAKLSRKYRAPVDVPAPAGTCRCLLWMRYWTKYGGVVTLGITDSGLLMRLVWLFRPGHPTLLIPWDELVLVRRKRFFGFSRDEYRVLGEPAVPIRLTTPAARDIAEQAGGRWPTEVTPLDRND